MQILLFLLTKPQKGAMMKSKVDYLIMQHTLLNEQIDEMERKHKLPDVQQERVIAQLKKERLQIRDKITELRSDIEVE